MLHKQQMHVQFRSLTTVRPPESLPLCHGVLTYYFIEKTP